MILSEQETTPAGVGGGLFLIEAPRVEGEVERCKFRLREVRSAIAPMRSMHACGGPERAGRDPAHWRKSTTIMEHIRVR